MKKAFVYRIIKYQNFQHHKSPTLSQTKFRMTESIVSVDNRQIREKQKTNNPQTMNERWNDSLKAYISSIFIKKNIQKHYKKKTIERESQYKSQMVVVIIIIINI